MRLPDGRSNTSDMNTTRCITSLVGVPACCLALLSCSAPADSGRVAEPSPALTTMCETTTTTVQLVRGGPHAYDVTGELCWRGSPEDKVVQVLISGHTYDSTYWDLPYQPETYSYVEAAAAAGFVTYAIDRLGVGASTIPDDPASLTTPSHAFVVNQVIDALRSGETTDADVAGVVLVGHSLGGAVALYTAGFYGGVDGVVMTNSLGQTNPAFIPQLQQFQHPANADPAFQARPLPDGYVTTRPGQRGAAFYNTAYADPEVIRIDEEHKEFGTPESIATIRLAREPAITAELSLPVLFTVGENDALYCSAGDAALACDTAEAVVEREKPFLPRACVSAYVQPEAGHNGVLHPNAPDLFAHINGWIAAWAASSFDSPPQGECVVPSSTQ